MTPGLYRNPSNGNGGDVDPAQDAEPKTGFIDNRSTILKQGNFGLFGQPDPTRQVGGSGRGFTGSPQSGGDIDMGPDSS